jgi:hypothetical protein
VLSSDRHRNGKPETQREIATSYVNAQGRTALFAKPSSMAKLAGAGSREKPMSDNDLVLRVPHSLGAVEAKRRIASGVAAAKAQYGNYFRTSEAEWDGNRLTFCLTALAQTVRGTVDVEDDYVELRAQLPTVVRLLAKRFVPAVRDAGQKLLTKNP